MEWIASEKNLLCPEILNLVLRLHLLYRVSVDCGSHSIVAVDNITIFNRMGMPLEGNAIATVNME